MQETNMQRRNNLLMVLIAGLAVVVVLQALVMMRISRQDEATVKIIKPTEKTFQMDLKPKTGAAQPPASASTNWNPPFAVSPFGGLGLDPGIWDPFKEFRSMRQQMDQMFNDSFGRFQQSADFQSMWDGTTFAPSMDVEEKDEVYVVRMDIPGADKSNISVNINDRQLVVSGKVDETIEEQGKNQLRKERRSGEFKRSLTLPGPVKSDEMEAKYEDGVLTVTLPKAEEQRGARSINIK